MTLNCLQRTASRLVCEAMDQLDSNGNDEDEILTGSEDTTKQPWEHFQYLGGSGGTGKSWAIKAMQTGVFYQKGWRRPGSAAYSPLCHRAYVQGQRLHDSMPHVSDERRKQRWWRRRLLIVDEVSMIPCVCWPFRIRSSKPSRKGTNRMIGGSEGAGSN